MRRPLVTLTGAARGAPGRWTTATLPPLSVRGWTSPCCSVTLKMHELFKARSTGTKKTKRGPRAARDAARGGNGTLVCLAGRRIRRCTGRSAEAVVDTAAARPSARAVSTGPLAGLGGAPILAVRRAARLAREGAHEASVLARGGPCRADLLASRSQGRVSALRGGSSGAVGADARLSPQRRTQGQLSNSRVAIAAVGARACGPTLLGPWLSLHRAPLACPLRAHRREGCVVVTAPATLYTEGGSLT